MVILYGVGSHCKKITKEYNISLDEFEVLIDNALSQQDEWKDKILSWDNFLYNKDNYHSSTIVIGALRRYDEINREIIHSGLFKRENIIFIDDWAKINFRKTESMYNYIDEHERKSMRDISNNIGILNQKLLAEATVLCDRSEALKYIPKGGRVAEVGVAFGDFSKQIIETVEPEIFYAIDLFNETKGFWDNNVFEKNRLSHYDWYSDRFADLIAKGKMKLEKGISWEELGKFSDNYFDYIYLDAAHDYNSVKKDIEQIIKKIKPNGIVQFNDYTFQENYGVIPVVNKMIKETSSKVLYYCLAIDGFADLVVRVNKSINNSIL